ncbi:MAG: isochorismatase family protein, partial [Draconibacterium sp.]|nr:isochorismatase family protein [Draconibacterium sp.]
MRITKENTIGLVVDIQERLFPVMNKKEALLKNCKILVQGLNELGIPMVVSQQYTKGLGETLPEIKSLISDFKYFEKKEFSCWDVSEIKEKSKSQGAQNIIIFGIESHVCVLQTAVDLKDNGFNPIVVADCISSRTDANLELAKERFRNENITLTSYES